MDIDDKNEIKNFLRDKPCIKKPNTHKENNNRNFVTQAKLRSSRVHKI